MATPTPATRPQPKVSHKPSITGVVLALVSFVFSGIGHLFITAKYTPTGPTTGNVENEVGHAVATGTTSVLGALFGYPLLVIGIVLAFLSFIFIAIRLPKVRAAGIIFSFVAVAVAAWSLSIAFNAFDLITAKPAS